MSAIRCDRIDILGKVPWRDEYVRPVSPSPALASFDQWVADCVDYATRSSNGWGDEYATGAVYAFLFRTRKGNGAEGEELLAGAIAPSADGAGRRYPAAIVASVSVAADATATPEVLPLVLEELWQGASELLSEVATARAELDAERMRALRAGGGLALEEARSAYAQWTDTLTIDELWRALSQDPRVSAPEQAIGGIASAAGPFRAVERPRTPLTLRAPLGAAAGAAVCFWIDVVRRAAGWRATVPSFFWSHDGSTGTMLLHLGDPPRSTLSELWGPRRDRDEVFDLTAARAPAQPAAPLAGKGERPLSELLASIG